MSDILIQGVLLGGFAAHSEAVQGCPQCLPSMSLPRFYSELYQTIIILKKKTSLATLVLKSREKSFASNPSLH